MYRVILFDLDGTLIDSSDGIIKSVLYTLHFYGIEESDTDGLRRFIGPPLSESFEKFYAFSKEQAREAVDKFRERYNVKGYLECELYPDTKQVLTQLKEDGFLLGVATSKPEITARRILEQKGIADLFDEICGATMDGRIEKKADVLQELLRRHPEYVKEEMVLIGDTAFDVHGANALGIDSAAVGFGFGDVQEMRLAGAVEIFDSMQELKEYFIK